MRQSEKQNSVIKITVTVLYLHDKLLIQKVKDRLIFSVSYFECAEDDESDMDQEGIYYSHKNKQHYN